MYQYHVLQSADLCLHLHTVNYLNCFIMRSANNSVGIELDTAYSSSVTLKYNIYS